MSFHQIISTDPIKSSVTKKQLCAQSYYDKFYAEPAKSYK